MAGQEKKKVLSVDDRMNALEDNLAKMMGAIGTLAEAVKVSLQPQIPVIAPTVAQEPQEPQVEQTPQPQVPSQPSPGYEPGKQVAKKHAPVVAAPPVYNKPHVIAKLDAVQSVGPISGGHMTKAIAMMEKMNELQMGGQGYTCSDAAMFNSRTPRNNPKAKPIGHSND